MTDVEFRRLVLTTLLEAFVPEWQQLKKSRNEIIWEPVRESLSLLNTGRQDGTFANDGGPVATYRRLDQDTVVIHGDPKPHVLGIVNEFIRAVAKEIAKLPRDGDESHVCRYTKTDPQQILHALGVENDPASVKALANVPEDARQDILPLEVLVAKPSLTDEEYLICLRWRAHLDIALVSGT